MRVRAARVSAGANRLAVVKGGRATNAAKSKAVTPPGSWVISSGHPAARRGCTLAVAQRQAQPAGERDARPATIAITWSRSCTSLLVVHRRRHGAAVLRFRFGLNGAVATTYL
jgi:hypothetical protein